MNQNLNKDYEKWLVSFPDNLNKLNKCKFYIISTVGFYMHWNSNLVILGLTKYIP